MIWQKKGLIYAPNKQIWWQQDYAILPTPIHIPELGVIRIFFATTCKDQFGRITYIDVDELNPSRILNNIDHFVLDIGEIGSFDDCGLNPSSVTLVNGKFHLYYAGYQRHFRTPYSIFSGVAVSNDLEKFTRVQKVPILDRTEHELSLRSAPTIKKEENRFRMWYVSDNGWELMESGVHADRLMPKYSIKSACSIDGINWTTDEQEVLPMQPGEFGIARPYYFANSVGEQFLFYSIRSRNISYRIGFAKLNQQGKWCRDDKNVGINISKEGWDNEMICYPAVIEVKGRAYLFYNGNGNGKTGFGYAELTSW